jgi:DNA ligase 1
VKTTLFRKHAGGIGTWSIWYEGDQLYYSHATSEGGVETVHRSTIETNLSGRSLAQQAELEKNSRISRMMDRGYKRTRDEAMRGATNQLGLPNPMLALKIDDVKGRIAGGHVQPKLDGHRCIITKTDGEVVAYSRKGKAITTIPHILEHMSWLEEGMALDGELYIHGPKLQDISSLIKRDQSGSRDLNFYWYDLMERDPYYARYHKMRQIYEHRPMPGIHLVDTYEVSSLSEAWQYFEKFRSAGFEGAMLRLSTEGYRPNVRASQLLKLKERHDCEVVVLSAIPARDGSAILKVKTEWGTTFDTLAPGSVPEKIAVMQNISQYIGRKLTIHYAHLTTDKIPFHAVAMRWHEEV